jgi:hypothetical protein
MDASLPSPILFLENPELGALHILKTSLEVSRVVLLTAYRDGAEPAPPGYGEPEAYAKAMLYQIDALEATLEDYNESIERLREWRSQQSRDREIEF